MPRRPVQPAVQQKQQLAPDPPPAKKAQPPTKKTPSLGKKVSGVSGFTAEQVREYLFRIVGQLPPRGPTASSAARTQVASPCPKDNDN